MRNYILYFILSQIHLVNGDDETVIPEIQLLNVDYEVGFGLDLHFNFHSTFKGKINIQDGCMLMIFIMYFLDFL